MTEMHEGQKLRRTVHVYGIPGSVVVEMTAAGLVFKSKGTKVGVSLPWAAAVAAAETPMNVASKLHGRPVEFLVDMAGKVERRKLAKENQ